MLKVAIMFLTSPKYLFSIEIETSATVLQHIFSPEFDEKFWAPTRKLRPQPSS